MKKNQLKRQNSYAFSMPTFPAWKTSTCDHLLHRRRDSFLGSSPHQQQLRTRGVPRANQQSYAPAHETPLLPFGNAGKFSRLGNDFACSSTYYETETNVLAGRNSISKCASGTQTWNGSTQATTLALLQDEPVVVANARQALTKKTAPNFWCRTKELTRKHVGMVLITMRRYIECAIHHIHHMIYRRPPSPHVSLRCGYTNIFCPSLSPIRKHYRSRG
jgi:hypothetical protein